MNFRAQRYRETDVNITPLIDVVFLLLIFFMVSTTFEHESEITVALPEASAEQLQTREDLILVHIDANEQVYIGAEPLAGAGVAAISAALREQAGETGAMPVVIRADAAVSHQAVIEVMDAARQSGLVNIAFATSIEAEK